ncbi:hypothetical protein SD10_27695 [Spirosoma radiotolerans]|uniref:Uncharacterized protein n=1 Tax=Spirosoma radiotolerans TaxID=1379870 RepID=A0A0E4A0E5_9BACT|nr:hypothetical protein SD10_27695 [Spirosoma radiotolerans]
MTCIRNRRDLGQESMSQMMAKINVNMLSTVGLVQPSKRLGMNRRNKEMARQEVRFLCDINQAVTY